MCGRLGKRWKQLHKLIYLGAMLVVVHLAFVIKGDLFTLSGDVWKPLVAAITIGVLLIARLPPLKRAWLARRSRVRRAPRSADPLPAND